MLFVKYTRNGMKRSYYVSIRSRSSVSTSQERSQLHRPTMIYLSRLAKAENNLGPCAVQNSIKSKAETNILYRILMDIVGYCKLWKYLKISQGYTVSASATTSWRCFGSPHVTEKYCWESDQSEHLWDDAGTPLAPRLLFKAFMVLRTEPSEPETITNGTNQKSIQDDLHGDLRHIKKVPKPMSFL